MNAKKLIASAFRFETLSVLFSLLSVLLGFLICLSWFTDQIQFTEPSDRVAMVFNTALGFIFAGLGAFMLTLKRLLAAKMFASIVFAISFATAVQYWFDLNLGIDQLIVRYQGSDSQFPGRMSPNTTFCFVAIALTLLISSSKERLYIQVVKSILKVSVFLLSISALFGYALNIKSAYIWGFNPGMAVHTALGFIWLVLALMTSKSQSRVSGDKTSRILSAVKGYAYVTGFVFIFWLILKHEQFQSEKALMESNFYSHQIFISNYIEQMFASLSRMARRWEFQRGTPRGEWEYDATNYTKTLPGLIGIEYVSPELEVKWVVPSKGNLTVKNLNLGLETHRRTLFLKARNSKRVQVSNKLKLFQGGDGFLIILPLYLPDHFDGFLVAVIRLDEFFSSFSQKMGMLNTDLVIYDAEEPIFESHQGDPEELTVWSEVRALDVSEVNWFVQIGSQSNSLTQQKINLADLWLLLGNLVTVLALTAFLFWEKNRKLELNSSNNERFFELFHGAPIPITLVNQEGNFELVNQAFLNLLGYDRTEIDHIDLNDILIVEQGIIPRSWFQQLFVTKIDFDQHHRITVVRKDGSQIAVESVFNLISRADHKKLIVSWFDISERELYIKELNRSNEALKKFTYIASHDLKAPLRGIHQLCNWLEEDLPDQLTPECQEHLDLMRNRIQRMEKMLTDLLAFSKVGQSHEKKEWVDIKKFLLELFQFRKGNANFKLKLSGDFPAFETERVPLELVLRNLIDNAIKHHDRSNGIISIAVTDQGNFLEFKVTDDGPGIPADLVERAFALFQTLRPRDKVEGSGIGLAMVKRTIESLGGDITLHENYPRGLIVTFTWPKLVTKSDAVINS